MNNKTGIMISFAQLKQLLLLVSMMLLLNSSAIVVNAAAVRAGAAFPIIDGERHPLQLQQQHTVVEHGHLTGSNSGTKIMPIAGMQTNNNVKKSLSLCKCPVGNGQAAKAGAAALRPKRAICDICDNEFESDEDHVDVCPECEANIDNDDDNDDDEPESPTSVLDLESSDDYDNHDNDDASEGSDDGDVADDDE